jgi:hypothetical protein
MMYAGGPGGRHGDSWTLTIPAQPSCRDDNGWDLCARLAAAKDDGDGTTAALVPVGEWLGTR